MSGGRHPRGFTLIELLVIVAIVGLMAGVAVVSVRAGRDAVRLRGAARDVFAAIRHARSQALVSQKPVVVTYSTSIDPESGEPVATVETTSAKLFSKGVDRSKIQLFTGGYLPAERGAAAAAEDDGGSLVEDVLFAPINKEVVRGMRIKAVLGDDDPASAADAAGRRLSVFSSTDYLLGLFKTAKAKEATEEAAQSSPSEGSSPGAASSGGAVADDAPVSVVWETNGRVEPHRVWVYADGTEPESGLSVRIDRFGAAKVESGDGRE